MNIAERIAELRSLMRQNDVLFYIIFGTDPHASEYMADCWKENAYLTGFQGEACTTVVTPTEVRLWTDSRYYLQADKELAGTEIILMRESEIDTPSPEQWIASAIEEPESRIALDAKLISVNQFEQFNQKLAAYGGIVEDMDLLTHIWNEENRPQLPDGKVFAFDEKYAGESTQRKLKRIREDIASTGANAMMISALDEIAWTLNLRGSDIDFNPVFVSYLLLRQQDAVLFIDAEKLTDEVKDYLHTNRIEVAPYAQAYNLNRYLDEESVVLFDGARLNQGLLNSLQHSYIQGLQNRQSPILVMKSQKNETELAGVKKAMHKDGVALTKFFRWLEQHIGKERLTEVDLMRKLHSFRAEQENFIEESFETIAGYNANGAIVHYEAREDDCAEVCPEGILLLDSGGQYLDGTTDITRTIALSEPSAQAKRDYTLVMKGHIALASARFPKGTRGNQLDVLARQFLWQNGLHYGHGTGHGVGHFLGCHEGPQNIRTDNNPSPLRLGNICSDEPGLYRAGEYGIRIENLVTVVSAEKNDFGEFYKWETLTLCYYDTTLLDLTLLTEQERQWINDYHKRVYAELSPLLDKETADWLKQKCKEI
ncbi:MAG: aminopeptidase P family protein [Paludibacteraceae bacterium]|nr:aminopeptidase P family protein [Paludibacteraceae bacterium]